MPDSSQCLDKTQCYDKLTETCWSCVYRRTSEAAGDRELPSSMASIPAMGTFSGKSAIFTSTYLAPTTASSISSMPATSPEQPRLFTSPYLEPKYTILVAIVGISILIVIVACACIFWKRRCKHRTTTGDTPQADRTHPGPSHLEMPETLPADVSVQIGERSALDVQLEAGSGDVESEKQETIKIETL